MRLLRRPCLVLLFAGALPGAGAAQPLWIGDPGRPDFTLEALRPDFEGEDGLTFPSSAWFAGVRLRLAAGTLLVAELPFATIDVDEEFFGESETAFGNPYVGLELGNREAAILQFGGRIPIAEEGDAGARLFGLFADLNRWEAWVENMVPFYLQVHYQAVNPEGMGVRVGGGPVAWVATEEGEDTEILATYVLQAVYRGQRFEAAGGIDGRVILTEDELLGDDRFQHEFVLSASPVLGRTRLGMQFRIPVGGSLGDFVDYTFGLHLAVPTS
jgi:hypothetical protein